MSHSSDFLTFTLPPSPHSSLPSTTSALPPDFSLLLTDTLDAPATFLIVQLVARALRPAQPEPGRRAEKRRRVVVVGVREREDHWAGTLKKHVRPCFHYAPERCVIAAKRAGVSQPCSPRSSLSRSRASNSRPSRPQDASPSSTPLPQAPPCPTSSPRCELLSRPRRPSPARDLLKHRSETDRQTRSSQARSS